MSSRRLRTRTQRGLGPRPKTLRMRVLERQVVREAEPLFDAMLPTPKRPRTRGDCVPGVGIRPCPFVSCRHHLYLDVKDSGLLRLNFPGPDGKGVELEELKETCSLDVADRHEAAGTRATHEQVGDLVNMHRERVRQIETDVLSTIRARHEEGEDE